MMCSTFLLGVLLAVSAQQSLRDCLITAEEAEQRDPLQAEELLKSCQNQYPASIYPYLRLCGLYQRLGRNEELYEIALQGLSKFPEERRFYFVVGVYAGRHGQCGQAVEVLSAGFDRWPQDQDLRNYLVNAYLCRGGDRLDAGENQKAAEDFTRLLKLEPDNIRALLNLGRAQHNMQLSSDALKTFDRAYAVDPQTPLIFFHRGVSLYALGRFDETIGVLNLQLINRPDHVQSFYFRGLAHLYKGGWGLAFADLKIAVEGMPDSSEAVFRLGRCLDHLGKVDEAETAFRRSIQLDPNDTRPLYALGNLLLKTGRNDEAETLLSRAVELYEEKISRPPGGVQFKSITWQPEE